MIVRKAKKMGKAAKTIKDMIRVNTILKREKEAHAEKEFERESGGVRVVIKGDHTLVTIDGCQGGGESVVRLFNACLQDADAVLRASVQQIAKEKKVDHLLSEIEGTL